jgi:hypothetical protein
MDKRDPPIVVSGHQPTYLPWLGLFHKIASCNIFVFMDDVQYLSGDWNNRNKIKGPQGPYWLTVPVRLKASSSMLLKDILIDDGAFGSKGDWQEIHWRSLQHSYGKTPHWNQYKGWLEDIYKGTRWTHLAELCEAMLTFFIKELDLDVRFVKASEMNFTGRKSDLVLEHCTRFDAQMCVLGTHGRDYIKTDDFLGRGISLMFQEYAHPVYHQSYGPFAPQLSIIDLLCNCGAESKEILLSGNVLLSELYEWLDGRVEPSIFTPVRKELVP